MPLPSRSAVFLALFLPACGDPASPAPVIELAPGPDTVATGYAEVVDAAWLGEDRWAVVAPLDVTVGLVDVGDRSVSPLGGEATREIRNPSIVFVAGDSLYVGDWGLRRIGVWTLDGRLTRAIPAPGRTRGALPEDRDDAGRWYVEQKPSPGPDGSGNRDSAAVVMTGPAFESLDTVARLAPLDLAEVAGDAGRRFEPRALSGTDEWGVLPDGSVWVARAFENRVEWRAPDGTRTEGDPLPDRVLEVTQYDRELFYRKFPPELRAAAEQLPFAAVKPPFESGLTSPAGTVWLEKSRAPADSARRYHEVDRAGRLLRDIRVPGRGRIVAVGAKAALVAERVTDGTRFIAFPIPAGATAPASGGAR
ncbi:MAG: hypothetical protein ACREM9_06755 [Gemmatimonadales bacterium]